jgi:hypothetical protein
VAEHDGRLVRFLPRLLGFAREYGFYPLRLQVWRRAGKKARWSARSATLARFAGRFASSPISMT